jgi:hypothetical protein
MCVLSDFDYLFLSLFFSLVDRLSHDVHIDHESPPTWSIYQCRALFFTLVCTLFSLLLDSPSFGLNRRHLFSPFISVGLSAIYNPAFASQHFIPLAHSPIIFSTLFSIPLRPLIVSVLFLLYVLFFPCRLMIHFPQLFEMREALVVIGSVLLGCIFC